MLGKCFASLGLSDTDTKFLFEVPLLSEINMLRILDLFNEPYSDNNNYNVVTYQVEYLKTIMYE